MRKYKDSEPRRTFPPPKGWIIQERDRYGTLYQNPATGKTFYIRSCPVDAFPDEDEELINELD